MIIKNLENMKLNLELYPTMTKSESFTEGQVEALGFCIRKHKENWSINDFIKDLEETKKEFTVPYDDYEKGIIDTLKYNIEKMEVVTNECI